MKSRIALVVFIVLPSVFLAAQQPLFPLASFHGISASMQYPASWTYELNDAPGYFVFVAAPDALDQQDPLAAPDFEQMYQSHRPFAMAELRSEEDLGQDDWLKTLYDLAESSAPAEGNDLVRSEASTLYELPAKLLVFNDQGTGMQKYLVAARTQDGQAAMFLAFCPTEEAASYGELFSAMHASLMPVQPQRDLFGYTRVETGSLSIHNPDAWSAFHVESPLVEIAMFAGGEIDFASFKEFTTDMLPTAYPLAMIMRGPGAAVFGDDVQSAREAIDSLVASLGSTDTVLSSSSVDMSGTPGERVVAEATIDTSTVKMNVGLYLVVTTSPQGEACVFLGLAPQEGFAETQRQFEEMSTSLFFQRPRS
jgi:hypothetical protein